MKNILLCSIDVPFIGGAGTNSYNLIKLLRGFLKYNVVGLFIYTNDLFKKDPHNIGNILKYNPMKDNIDIIREEIINIFNDEPNLILAKNYISVFIGKKLFPKVKLFFLPSGSSFFNLYCEQYGMITIKELIKKLETGYVKLSNIVKYKGNWPCFPQSCKLGCDCETRAICIADKIIPNSQITEQFYKALYKNIKMVGRSISDKITNYIFISGLYDTIYIKNIIKNIEFSERKYDIIFVCYNWKRKLKNMELVEKIVNDKLMKKYSIVVIGDQSNLLKSRNLNVTIIGYLENNKLLEYLENSRCLVCVSYYDSFPNVITEANLCGCNIVTSENVGQCKLIPKELVVSDFYNLNEWIDKIILGVKKKYRSFIIDHQEVLKKLDICMNQ